MPSTKYIHYHVSRLQLSLPDFRLKRAVSSMVEFLGLISSETDSKIKAGGGRGG